jgi:hypothetical protein
MSDTESDSGKEISTDEFDDLEGDDTSFPSPDHVLRILRGGGDAYGLFADCMRSQSSRCLFLVSCISQP